MIRTKLLEEKQNLERRLKEIDEEIHKMDTSARKEKVQAICDLMRDLYDSGCNNPFAIEDDDCDSIYVDFNDLADFLEFKFLRG